MLALRMKKAVRKGATLVVADPRKIWLTKLASRHLQGAVEDPEPSDLVGPHGGAKRQPPFLRRRVDRVEIATCPFRDGRPDLEGREAIALVDVVEPPYTTKILKCNHPASGRPLAGQGPSR